MALIPPFFADCVVAIGFDAENGSRMWAASGFLYGYKSKVQENQYYTYLATNRHVLEGKSRAYLRFNPQANEAAREYPVDLVKNGKALWLEHPKKDIDIALMPIRYKVLQEHTMQVEFFKSDEHTANTMRLRELGIAEGDFAYVLGFPMGLTGERRNTVIVRGGCIARIRDALSGDSSMFLVDASIFPGNSGGPVITKPELLAIEGTKRQGASYLIGIVRSYVSYQDIAVSSQTGRPRITFEENSGLAETYPVDFIEEIVRIAVKEPVAETGAEPSSALPSTDSS